MTNNMINTMTASLIGQSIAKYELVKLLGSGGMAQVYQATQTPLERKVALKILHPHLTIHEELRERFLREAKATASLQHANIVQIYDYDYSDGVCYMAMEFLDGESLEERLKSFVYDREDCDMTVAEALDIVIQIAQALAFAHSIGIVHRDVKPGNVMLTRDGRVVLTDFGIATVLSETRLTVEGGTTGTPTYMSPEQALGERGDERSDVYSLGIVLYQLVTGVVPFEADTMFGLIMKHVNDPPPPATETNPNLNPIIDQVIRKALAKQSEDRYQTAQAMTDDLQAIRDGREISIIVPDSTSADEEPDPAPQTAPNWWQNQRVWGAAVAAVTVLLVGLWLINARNTAPAEDGVQSMASQDTGVQSMAAEDSGVESMAAEPRLITELTRDDFSNNHNNWMLSNPPVARQVVSDSYQVTLESPALAISSYPTTILARDFSYEVLATLVEGQDESGYGLVFRQQDNRNYYVFGINGLRQWSVWRLEDGTWSELRQLADGPWTFDEAILSAGEVNRLRVEVIGSQIRLFANDTLLTPQPIVDDSFEQGGIGLYVASSQTADPALASIQFDDVLIEPFDETSQPSMTTN